MFFFPIVVSCDSVSQNKFSDENIIRYGEYLLAIAEVDPKRVKYLDECHFVSSSLHRQRALGPVGNRVFVIDDNQMDGNLRFTLTLCTSIQSPDNMFWVRATTEKNNAANFGAIVLEMLQANFLQRGDVLVMDNSPVSSDIECLIELFKVI